MQIIKKRKVIAFLLIGIALLAFLWLASIPTLQAANEQADDLVVTVDPDSKSVTQIFNLTIKDKNPNDSKVIVPLNGNFTFIDSLEGGSTVTKDEAKQQLIIDWPEGGEKKAVLKFKATTYGTYTLRAYTIRDTQMVTSAPVEINYEAEAQADSKEAVDAKTEKAAEKKNNANGN
ncbi:hypothetical protein [Listeria floridensis]|nr:hypothetical protein [Listeria floridensis]